MDNAQTPARISWLQWYTYQYHTSSLRVALELFNVIASLVSVGVYVYHTYINIADITNWVYFICSVSFSLEYLARGAAAKNKVKYVLWDWSIIDVVTIVFGFVQFNDPNLTNGLGFMRVMRVIQVVRLLKVGTATLLKASGHAAEQPIRLAFYQAALDLTVTLLGVLFISACVFWELETAAWEDDRPLRLHSAFYWACVTVATIGYGDYYPTTLAGQLLFPAMIVVVLLVLPQKLSDLSSVLKEYSRHMRMYYSAHRFGSHVVLTGHVTPQSARTFITEFYHPDRGYQDMDVVLLRPLEPEPELSIAMSDSRLERRVRYLHGSPFRVEDLSRADAARAQAIYVMANKHAADPAAEDRTTLLTVLALGHFLRQNVADEEGAQPRVVGWGAGPGQADADLARSPRVPHLVVQFLVDGAADRAEALLRTGKHHPPELGLLPLEINPFVLCLGDLRSWLLGASLHTPGLVALVANLCTSSRMERHTWRGREDLSMLDGCGWLPEYFHGAGVELYDVTFPQPYHGLTFRQAALRLWEEESVILIGLRFPDHADGSQQYDVKLAPLVGWPQPQPPAGMGGAMEPLLEGNPFPAPAPGDAGGAWGPQPQPPYEPSNSPQTRDHLLPINGRTVGYILSEDALVLGSATMGFKNALDPDDSGALQASAAHQYNSVDGGILRRSAGTAATRRSREEQVSRTPAPAASGELLLSSPTADGAPATPSTQVAGSVELTATPGSQQPSAGGAPAATPPCSRRASRAAGGAGAEGEEPDLAALSLALADGMAAAAVPEPAAAGQAEDMPPRVRRLSDAARAAAELVPPSGSPSPAVVLDLAAGLGHQEGYSAIAQGTRGPDVSPPSSWTGAGAASVSQPRAAAEASGVMKRTSSAAITPAGPHGSGAVAGSMQRTWSEGTAVSGSGGGSRAGIPSEPPFVDSQVASNGAVDGGLLVSASPGPQADSPGPSSIPSAKEAKDAQTAGVGAASPSGLPTAVGAVVEGVGPSAAGGPVPPVSSHVGAVVARAAADADPSSRGGPVSGGGEERPSGSRPTGQQLWASAHRSIAAAGGGQAPHTTAGQRHEGGEEGRGAWAASPAAPSEASNHHHSGGRFPGGSLLSWGPGQEDLLASHTGALLPAASSELGSSLALTPSAPPSQLGGGKDGGAPLPGSPSPSRGPLPVSRLSSRSSLVSQSMQDFMSGMAAKASGSAKDRSGAGNASMDRGSLSRPTGRASIGTQSRPVAGSGTSLMDVVGQVMRTHGALAGGGAAAAPPPAAATGTMRQRGYKVSTNSRDIAALAAASRGHRKAYSLLRGPPSVGHLPITRQASGASGEQHGEPGLPEVALPVRCTSLEHMRPLERPVVVAGSSCFSALPQLVAAIRAAPPVGPSAHFRSCPIVIYDDSRHNPANPYKAAIGEGVLAAIAAVPGCLPDRVFVLRASPLEEAGLRKMNLRPGTQVYAVLAPAADPASEAAALGSAPALPDSGVLLAAGALREHCEMLSCPLAAVAEVLSLPSAAYALPLCAAEGPYRGPLPGGMLQLGAGGALRHTLSMNKGATGRIVASSVSRLLRLTPDIRQDLRDTARVLSAEARRDAYLAHLLSSMPHLAPSLASGHVLMQPWVDALFCQTIFNPMMLQILLKLLYCGDDAEGSAPGLPAANLSRRPSQARLHTGLQDASSSVHQLPYGYGGTPFGNHALGVTPSISLTEPPPEPRTAAHHAASLTHGSPNAAAAFSLAAQSAPWPSIVEAHSAYPSLHHASLPPFAPYAHPPMHPLAAQGQAPDGRAAGACFSVPETSAHGQMRPPDSFFDGPAVDDAAAAPTVSTTVRIFSISFRQMQDSIHGLRDELHAASQPTPAGDPQPRRGSLPGSLPSPSWLPYTNPLWAGSGSLRGMDRRRSGRSSGRTQAAQGPEPAGAAQHGPTFDALLRVLVAQHDMLPIGLYRRDEGAAVRIESSRHSRSSSHRPAASLGAGAAPGGQAGPGGGSGLPYVYTKPAGGTVLRDSDDVYVLASAAVVVRAMQWQSPTQGGAGGL